MRKMRNKEWFYLTVCLIFMLSVCDLSKLGKNAVVGLLVVTIIVLIEGIIWLGIMIAKETIKEFKPKKKTRKKKDYIKNGIDTRPIKEQLDEVFNKND